MKVEVFATLLGVSLAALVAACGADFRWLRSDFRDLRNHVDTRFDEQATTTSAQFTAVDLRFDRLEAKVDDLIMAPARARPLVDPQPPAPPVSSPAPDPPAAPNSASEGGPHEREQGGNETAA
ncbi:MAG: hypothetical protein F4110_13765 [Acidimicrobiaceae bacterium]|nr:hypothetical protein [Acidimicrobiaceae bacterium]MXZ98508.1 hypothetical protein [Acidimicrobiaceae bacterium]MYE74851.1 hypothetical protein [Acidimicrobiaceae bacterium]MYE97367.1 hypothetical protein [Acidimicrobiaceae bacterium]MYH42956.1 hypothetical protein [Acidimicrobiaceae bacterium]